MTFPREQQTGLQTQTPHLKLLWDLVPELTLSCHHGLERGWEAHLSKGLGHRAPAASNPLLPHGRPLPPGQPTPDSAQVSSQGTGNDVTSPRSHSQGDTAALQSGKLVTFQLPKRTAQRNSQARPRGRGSGQGARSLLRPGWSWEVEAWFPSRTDTKKPSPNSHTASGWQLSAPECPAEGKRGLCSQLQDADSPGTQAVSDKRRRRDQKLRATCGTFSPP